MSRYLYYPGCSLSSTARAYAESLTAILAPLGVELQEIDDWNCCGATEYVTLSPLGGYALIGRNLALAEQQRGGLDTLVAPCSACYVNLVKTDRYVRESPVLREQLNEALAADSLHYTPGSMTVRHLLEVLIDDVGLDEVARHVTRPLHGLRVASYLGCLVSRPDHDGRWSSREQPLELDRLMTALGAEVVDYPLRTACCGGHMTQISPNTGFELIRRLVDGADRLRCRPAGHRLPDVPDERRRLPGRDEPPLPDPLPRARSCSSPSSSVSPSAWSPRRSGSARSSSPRATRSAASGSRCRRRRRRKRPPRVRPGDRRARPGAAAEPADARATSGRAMTEPRPARDGARGTTSAPAARRVHADRRLRLPLRHQHRRRRRRRGGSRLGRRAPGAARRRRRARLHVHVLEPRPGADRGGHPTSWGSTASWSPPAPRTCTRRRSAAPASGPGSTPTCASSSRSANRSRGSTPTSAAATAKAKAILAGGVLRVREHVPLEPLRVPINEATLVVGGGIAGITAALEIADAGFPVHLVERAAVDRRPHGPVRQDLPDARLRGLHPHPEDGHRGLPPEHHAPHLERGHRRLGLRRQLHGQGPPPAALRRHRPVHRLRHLPGEVPGQGHRPDVRGRASATARRSTGRSRRPSPSTRSSTPTTASTSRSGTCKACEKLCPPGAIRLDQQPEEVTLQVGNIVLATGLRAVRRPTRRAVRLRPAGERVHQPRVRADEQRQRTDRRADRPARRRDRARRAWRSSTASGSRDRNYNNYCSAICCMQSMKFAHLVREHTDATVYEFYIDIRAPGKAYDEFYQRVQDEGTIFVRGRVAEVTDAARLPEEAAEDGRLIVQVEDTLAGRQRRIPVDMVVLSVGLEPQPDAKEVARRVRHHLQLRGLGHRAAPQARSGRHDDRGRLRRRLRAGPARHPVERRQRRGGRGPDPRPHPAAARWRSSRSARSIDAERCSGCRICNDLCPFSAILFDDGPRRHRGQPGALPGLRRVHRRLPGRRDQRHRLQRRADPRPDRGPPDGLNRRDRRR